jgi:hypothetical protein
VVFKFNQAILHTQIPPMKKILLSTFVAAAFAVGSVQAQIAIDNAGNYGGGWTDGSNGGSGFSPWVISIDQGTGFSGNFIGDPNAAGITGMGTEAFGLYANPVGSGAFVNVSRAFPALEVGQFFSVEFGVNFDAGGGNKGLNILSGGDQLFNINQGDFPGDITFNTINTGITYGLDPMTWTFTHITAGNVLVEATGRTAGSGIVFTTNVVVAGAPDTFQFYTSAMEAGDERQLYFNNPTVVPEPSTYALLTLGALALGGYAARRRARK